MHSMCFVMCICSCMCRIYLHLHETDYLEPSLSVCHSEKSIYCEDEKVTRSKIKDVSYRNLHLHTTHTKNSHSSKSPQPYLGNAKRHKHFTLHKMKSSSMPQLTSFCGIKLILAFAFKSNVSLRRVHCAHCN